MVEVSHDEQENAECHEGSESVQVAERGCIHKEDFEDRESKKRDGEPSGDEGAFDDAEDENGKRIDGPEDGERSVLGGDERVWQLVTERVDFAGKPSGDL